MSSPLYVLSIAVLVLNDLWLKYAWPGLVTGKLSDVAGLFAFAVFWSCITRRPALACSAVAAFVEINYRTLAVSPGRDVAIITKVLGREPAVLELASLTIWRGRAGEEAAVRAELRARMGDCFGDALTFSASQSSGGPPPRQP